MTDLTRASDAYLAGCIVNGDADALRPLIERYQAALRALLSRALGASPDVDDLAQETWMRVVRSAHRYDPEQRFSAWLFAIAWNLVRDRWARTPRTVDDAELEELPSTHASAEDAAVASDEARRVRKLVEELPERLSEAIFLRYFEELSEKEMAERLGVPLGTVKSRIHNGLRRLHDELHGRHGRTALHDRTRRLAPR